MIIRTYNEKNGGYDVQPILAVDVDKLLAYRALWECPAEQTLFVELLQFQAP
jgi:hypothetical protein